MKKLRRISILALVIVLVCAFSASAFAAAVFEDIMDCGNTEELAVNAEIERYSTSGEISHLTYDSANNYSSISMTCTYYLDTNGTRAIFSDSNVTYSEYYCSIGKSIDQSCFAMISATYTFEAQVSAQWGSQSYGPVTATLNY